MITRRQNRRGHALSTGLFSIVLMCCGALVVDTGILFTAHAELQTTADAAALAAVGYLDGTEDGLSESRAKALEFAAYNKVLGEKVDMKDAHLTFGYLDDDGDAFTPSDDPELVDTLRIDLPSEQNLFFAPAAMMYSTATVSVRSTAQRSPPEPAGVVECHLPIAVPDCVVDGSITLVELSMSRDSGSAGAFAGVVGKPTSTVLSTGIQNECGQGHTVVGDRAFLLSLGADALMDVMVDVLGASSTLDTEPWDTVAFGPLPPQEPGSDLTVQAYGENTLQAPILLFDGGDCDGPPTIDPVVNITGFAWGVIYDVQTEGLARKVKLKIDLETPRPVGYHLPVDIDLEPIAANITTATTAHLEAK